jgi:hypothetical protein
VIVPVVAVCGESAIAIGAGFTIASFGLVTTPAVVAVAALQRASRSPESARNDTAARPRIGCVIGEGVHGGRHVGRLVLVEQIYTHGFTDLALLQLALPGSGPGGIFPMLPLTMNRPDVGTRLVVAGYSEIARPGTIRDGNRVVHNWQLSAYWASVAGYAEAPRKQGPPAQLMLLADNRSFDPGLIGGPIFSVSQASRGSYDPVCAALGEYASGDRSIAYGIPLAPALGLRLAFPNGNIVGTRSLYEVVKGEDLTAIEGLEQLRLSSIEERYSLVLAAPEESINRCLRGQDRGEPWILRLYRC